MISAVVAELGAVMRLVSSPSGQVTVVDGSGQVDNLWPPVDGRCVFLGTTTVKRSSPGPDVTVEWPVCCRPVAVAVVVAQLLLPVDGASTPDGDVDVADGTVTTLRLPWIL